MLNCVSTVLCHPLCSQISRGGRHLSFALTPPHSVEPDLTVIWFVWWNRKMNVTCAWNICSCMFRKMCSKGSQKWRLLFIFQHNLQGLKIYLGQTDLAWVHWYHKYSCFKLMHINCLFIHINSVILYKTNTAVKAKIFIICSQSRWKTTIFCTDSFSQGEESLAKNCGYFISGWPQKQVKIVKITLYN